MTDKADAFQGGAESGRQECTDCGIDNHHGQLYAEGVLT
jgi:hypothetical protein